MTGSIVNVTTPPPPVEIRLVMSIEEARALRDLFSSLSPLKAKDISSNERWVLPRTPNDLNTYMTDDLYRILRQVA
jgi:hypothetical protein